MTLPLAAAKKEKPGSGLGFWMQRVLEECDHAGIELAPDPVHDLRVALRRCRSMADGLMAIDPDPTWKQMKKAGRRLFRRLGELRDFQVMEEWVRRLGASDDPVTQRLLQFFAGREFQLKQEAAAALQEFDRKQWARWSVVLSRRAAKIRNGSAIFKHLALERWTEAHALHRLALRNRSRTAWHNLRIGIKRFRYIVENFLPDLHNSWRDDLKELQDLLGEVHDLDVLWATALQIRAYPNSDSRDHWHGKVTAERGERIEKYRSKMLGENSLWQKWRAELPSGKEIESAALSRLKLWGALLDPDTRHATHVARLALQLYDGLPVTRLTEAESKRQRLILQVAALLHDVGRSQKGANHHKATFSLLRQLKPPLGWTSEAMLIAGAAARYHRGALPQAGQKTMAAFTPVQRETIRRLGGILRLANAMDAERDGRIQRARIHEQNGFLVLAAQGYSACDRLAEKISAGRHLLETVCRKPILVKPLRPERVLATKANHR